MNPNQNIRNLDDMDIFFEIDGEQHKIPVLPENLTFQLQTGAVLTETVRLGEISVLRDRKLKTFQLSSFFPWYGDRSFIRTLDDFKKPAHYIELFTKALESKTPMNFVPTGLNEKTFYVSIDSFEYAHTAQDEDINYTLTLREYRHYGKEGRKLDKREPLFDGGETKAYESDRETRPKNGFAIGDRVIVNGRAYRDPWGAMPFARLPLNFMTTSPRGQMANAMAILKGARNNSLSNTECIIVGLETSVNTDAPAPYQYQIADARSRRAIGWINEDSMRHKR